ncbi:metal-dependent hydrolase [Nitrosococcus wardiae]|uniref:Metal-dependent hydrolase n=1 Tax=Nitrosococcus wardiae TaxID=1814290 RepID=A0A4P7BYI9_9GAMM|nr:metal-dependent hydrolase [Nitrosococcus wardiae]QBQ53486.1 metal-dependent hydrolase [Nitrosococcus wardiae]
MADFNTHMIGAAAVSGIGATVLMMTHTFPAQILMTYFVLGVVGGMLPDIDSDSSIPVRWTFNVLGVITGFFLVLYLGAHYSLIELVLLWGASFIIIRYGIFSLFTQLTVHRGLIHSIPAALFFSLGTVVLAVQALEVPVLNAWLCGTFVFLGFLTHLVLDELYSVDLMGVSVKRSFGTALNLGSFRAPLKTGLLYLLTGALFYLAPPIDDFLAFIFNSRVQQLFVERLFPVEGWFNTAAIDLF